MTVGQFLAIAAVVLSVLALIESRGRNTVAWAALCLSLIAIGAAFGLATLV